jgi:hypothetical protein
LRLSAIRQPVGYVENLAKYSVTLTAVRHNECRMPARTVVQRQSLHIGRSEETGFIVRKLTILARPQDRIRASGACMKWRTAARQVASAILTRHPKTRESLNV